MRSEPVTEAVETAIVAIPETAGSALYGMLDVLLAAGNLWQTLVRSEARRRCFRVRIVSTRRKSFDCGNGVPVRPDASIRNAPTADLVIVPELWLGPDETLQGRYPALIQWLRERYDDGATLCSACSGAILLAETGLLDGCPATSHWGYEALFRREFPRVRFDPGPSLISADRQGRLLTAGGTTSWHDLAIHLIARYAGPAEALRIAKVYLLKWHDEGQLAYARLDPVLPHGDSVVRACERFLRDEFARSDALNRVVERAGVPERTLKRRFKAATGQSLIAYLQNVRVEAAKSLLETTSLPVEEVSARVGYSDASFFRRLFKRLTGLTAGRYRRMFQPLAVSSPPEKDSGPAAVVGTGPDAV